MMFFGVRFCAVNNMQYFYLLNGAWSPECALLLKWQSMRAA